MSFARLAHHLHASGEEIIDRWQAAVRTDAAVPAAREVAGLPLQDHLPALLDEIIAALERMRPFDCPVFRSSLSSLCSSCLRVPPEFRPFAPFALSR